MKNRIRTMVDEVRGHKMSLGIDILLCVPALITAPVIGGVSSFVDPYYLVDKSKDIRKGNLDTLHEFVYHTLSSLTYAGSLFYFGSRIMENPKNAINYVPLALNAASGIWQFHKRNKKANLP